MTEKKDDFEYILPDASEDEIEQHEASADKPKQILSETEVQALLGTTPETRESLLAKHASLSQKLDGDLDKLDTIKGKERDELVQEILDTDEQMLECREKRKAISTPEERAEDDRKRALLKNRIRNLRKSNKKPNPQ